MPKKMLKACLSAGEERASVHEAISTYMSPVYCARSLSSIFRIAIENAMNTNETSSCIDGKGGPAWRVERAFNPA